MSEPNGLDLSTSTHNSLLLTRLEETLASFEGSQRELIAHLHTKFAFGLSSLPMKPKLMAMKALKSKIKSRKLVGLLQELLLQIESGNITSIHTELPVAKPAKPKVKKPISMPLVAQPINDSDRQELESLSGTIQRLRRFVQENPDFAIAEELQSSAEHELHPSWRWLTWITSWGRWLEQESDFEELLAASECQRLVQAGLLAPLGTNHRLQAHGPRWNLPRAYALFLLRFGSLSVFRNGALVFRILSPSEAAFESCDLTTALEDHRYSLWGEDTAPYGLDRSIVFCQDPTDDWDGWAFDTRVCAEDGSMAIRRLFDFEADGGNAMALEWPENRELEGDCDTQSFAAWLEQRVTRLTQEHIAA